jgi:hypothetical protein
VRVAGREEGPRGGLGGKRCDELDAGGSRIIFQQRRSDRDRLYVLRKCEGK